MDPIYQLEEIFRRFPGIGPRQAKRFVQHIQSKSPYSVSELIKLIKEVNATTKECAECHRLFVPRDNAGFENVSSDQDKSICNICADTERDQNTLMIVARGSDLEVIEKSGAYRGRYFVLGGTVPILDKEPEKQIKLSALKKRLQDDKTKADKPGESKIKEIILSLNTTPEGENTEQIVRNALKQLIDPAQIKISILGRGLSTGAELEYADSETIKNALGNRK